MDTDEDVRIRVRDTVTWWIEREGARSISFETTSSATYGMSHKAASEWAYVVLGFLLAVDGR